MRPSTCDLRGGTSAGKDMLPPRFHGGIPPVPAILPPRKSNVASRKSFSLFLSIQVDPFALLRGKDMRPSTCDLRGGKE